MTLSLVYQLKRRRLLSLGLLVLALLAVAMFITPGWQPAGPVYAEKVGDAVALVLVEPEAVYRISWRRKNGNWEETEPFTGRVTATMGGEKLVVFHGAAYTTYATGKDGGAPVNERWDRFTPGWSVVAATQAAMPDRGGTVEAWAFGTLDGRTIASAALITGTWIQGPELKRSSTVGELTVAAEPWHAWLWWRENGVVVKAQFIEKRRTPGNLPEFPPSLGWGETTTVDVPQDAHLSAASNKQGPALYAASRLKKNPISVMEISAAGGRREVQLKKDPPITAAIDSISVADGDPPGIAYASGMAAGLAFLDKDQSFEDLLHTLFRFRPGAVPWFMSMMFASLSIVGIGVSLLFERKKVSQDALAEQGRMLAGVAPLMSRAFAASIDTGPFLWGFAWLAVEAGAPPTFAWIGSIALCCAYHTGAEAVWGQTLGKRLAGIVVKRTDGTPAGLQRIVVRNMIRAVELMIPLLPAVVMISTKRSQRLGDLVAGTIVAKLEKEPQPEGEEAR
ncbi:MAG: RDD domain-containing [Planctomycetota bacterium]|nr:MAG: RDD domain-containing [Planctomycetota bacterium]